MTNQNVHCLGKLEILCGLTDGVLVDMSTGWQVDRLTGRQVHCLCKLEMLCGLKDGVLVDRLTG